MKRMFRILLTISGYKALFCASMLLLMGCATIPHKSIPVVQEKITVRVVAEEASGWSDLSLGAYRIPKSHVVITTEEKSQADKMGMQFGLVGAILGTYAAHQYGVNAGKRAVNKEEDILRFNLVSDTRAILRERLNHENAPENWTMGQEASYSIEIIPYLILAVDRLQQTRPYLFLKTRLLDKSRKEIWWTRYIYYFVEAEKRPILGEGGWTENNGEALGLGIVKALHKVIDVMFIDARYETAWKSRKPCKILARPAGTFGSGDLQGEILDETEEFLIFSFQGRGAIIKGINIIPQRDARKISP